jgi:hypothetical protein
MQWKETFSTGWDAWMYALACMEVFGWIWWWLIEELIIKLLIGFV